MTTPLYFKLSYIYYDRSKNWVTDFCSTSQLQLINSSWKESKNLVLASGEDFPDALSGAAVAAKNSSFIVLTPKTPNSKTKVFLYSLTKLNSTTKNIVVLGGAGVIPDETIEKLTTREEDYLGNVINGLSVSYNNGYIL
ncbi:cell wall-binding repeat-containing protein [Clostridium magnum]|uniref:cell wall-binding repeat-containing protein n=1 Tax=Clostridium magnum TaxID=33954 RepID=UPI0009EDAA54